MCDVFILVYNAWCCVFLLIYNMILIMFHVCVGNADCVCVLCVVYGVVCVCVCVCREACCVVRMLFINVTHFDDICNVVSRNVMGRCNDVCLIAWLCVCVFCIVCIVYMCMLI